MSLKEQFDKLKNALDEGSIHSNIQCPYGKYAATANCWLALRSTSKGHYLKGCIIFCLFAKTCKNEEVR